jgi:hypothetical protein
MISIRVLNSDFYNVCDEKYDLAFFASGYESRSIYVPSQVPSGNVRNAMVFGFKEEQKCENRIRNDAHFAAIWNVNPTLVSGDDERPIFDFLNHHSAGLDSPVKILLDYSSMSRLWYTAVLNWARFASFGKSVVIDFIYAVGEYRRNSPPFVIRGMVSLPGCEGRAYRLRESVAVFGLGFHGDASLCVLDHLEADIVYAFLASPGSRTEYEKEVRERNRDLIENRKIKHLLELPFDNVESCYRTLAETIAPYRPDGEITLVPMGPKPHVLASILIAMRFPEVACLRISSTPDISDVVATGEVVATRVIISSNENVSSA